MAAAVLLPLALGATLGACSGQAEALAQASPGAIRSDNVQAVAASDGLLVAGTGAGAMLSSSDAGTHWSRRELGTPASIIDLASCKTGDMYALDFYRQIWRGSSGAAQWTAHPLPGAVTPLALTCQPNGTVWVVGSQSSILSSSDGGASWSSYSLKKDAMLRTIQFVDNERGFITGEFGIVLSTQDGGKTWQAPGKLGDDFYPYAAYFDDASNGWVSGLAGALLATRDGGRTWEAQDNPSRVSLYTLVKRGGILYALGEGGRIVQLVDGRWVALTQPVAAAYIAASANAGAAGLLVAGPGGVLAFVKPDVNQVPGGVR